MKPPRYVFDAANLLIDGPGLPARAVAGAFEAARLVDEYRSCYEAGYRQARGEFQASLPGRPGRRRLGDAHDLARLESVATAAVEAIRIAGGAATTRSLQRCLGVGYRQLLMALEVARKRGIVAESKVGLRRVGWRLAGAPDPEREPAPDAGENTLVDQRAEAILRRLAGAPMSGQALRRAVGGGSAIMKQALGALRDGLAVERRFVDGEPRGWTITGLGLATLAALDAERIAQDTPRIPETTIEPAE